MSPQSRILSPALVKNEFAVFADGSIASFLPLALHHKSPRTTVVHFIQNLEQRLLAMPLSQTCLSCPHNFPFRNRLRVWWKWRRTILSCQSHSRRTCHNYSHYISISYCIITIRTTISDCFSSSISDWL